MGTLRRYGWLGVLAVPVLGATTGILWYGSATGWYFMLPGLPPFERFLEEPARMNALAEAVGVPPPPGLTGVDEVTALQFFEQYGRLRRDRRNADAAGALGELFAARGEPAPAAACFRRAAEWAPDDPRWAERLAELSDPSGTSE